jgi:hypothetical protein
VDAKELVRTKCAVRSSIGRTIEEFMVAADSSLPTSRLNLVFGDYVDELQGGLDPPCAELEASLAEIEETNCCEIGLAHHSNYPKCWQILRTLIAI